MKKVKVTKEQAEAIEIPDDIFIAALHYGYEVEPKFEIGDWVVNTSNGYIRLVENEREANFLNNDYIKRHELRHATPEELAAEKERRWWAKHGRDVWELRKGDVLVDRGWIRVVDKIIDYQEKTVMFDDEDCEHYANVVNKYKVLCFAENRLDGDFGEGD